MTTTQTNNKPALIFIGLSALVFILFAAVLLFAAAPTQNNIAQAADSSVVSNFNGKQYIDLTAKDGYSPAVVKALADVDTVLRVKTDNTYGCEAALNIPALNIFKYLNPSGVAEIPLGAQPSGKELAVTCSMRMYNAVIKFS